MHTSLAVTVDGETMTLIASVKFNGNTDKYNDRFRIVMVFR